MGEWMRRAEGGDVKGMRELGERYQCGRGVAIDLVKGREWLEKAAAGRMWGRWICWEICTRMAWVG